MEHLSQEKTPSLVQAILMRHTPNKSRRCTVTPNCTGTVPKKPSGECDKCGKPHLFAAR